MSEEFQSVSTEPHATSGTRSWGDVKAILELALTLDSSEWSSFLDLRCGSDEELRREVESLLQAHDASSEFLERPLASVDALARVDLPAPPDTPTPGMRIGAYALEREIGHGGMGSVYLANRADEEFRKSVAIKLIRVEKQSDFTIRRFRQERQILAKLEHPYVARLIDGGTTNTGMPYLVMEYVEGEVLTHYCDAHELPTRERLELFLKICSAVQYAHERNIIHRDLKPANILVSGNGSPKLLDFGIAKILEPEIPGGNREATQAGVRMLTPAYASPEQMHGDPATVRSDVYSLGVILYELLCGERPSLKTVQQNCAGLGENEQHLSPNLRAIIFNSIRMAPEERYSSVASLAEDVKRYLEGLPIDAGAHTDPQLESGRISIGVLPFRELGHDSNADPFLRSAITDALITRLSRVARLSVRPTSAVLRYKQAKDTVHAARELRVMYLLEGTLHTVDDQVRLNVQLVSSETGLAVWAAQFDEQSTDLLRLEGSISEQIVFAVIPHLTGEERVNLSRAGTASGKAHQAYLRGRYHWSRSAGEPDELAKALTYFMQAIADDPSYARAHAGIADYYLRLALWGGLPPAESFAAGLDSARKALELDPTLGEAHASLGFCLWAYNGDYAAAEAEFNVAIARSPDSANAYHWFGLLNSVRNRPELALANLERASRIDPNSPVIAAALGFVYYNARQFSRSLELLNIAVRERRKSGVIHEMLTWCYLQLGDVPNALECARRAVDFAGRNPSSLAALARAEGVAGNRLAVLELLKEIDAMRGKRYVSGYDRASLLLALNDVPNTIGCLEEALEARDWWVLWIGVDPRWDSLRREPRFQELVRRTQATTLNKQESGGARRKTSKKTTVVAIAALFLVIAAAALLWKHAAGATIPFASPEFARITGDGIASRAALSPDGRDIVYTTAKQGKTQFWHRQLDRPTATMLAPPMLGDVSNLEFTSNGRDIAFEIGPTLQPYNRRLLFMSLRGGAPREVLSNLAGPIGLSHDGFQAAAIRANRSLNRDELWIIDLRHGGERMLFFRPYPERLSWDVPPVWSRNGRLIAFAVGGRDQKGFLITIQTVDVRSGATRKVISPRWLWMEHIAWIKGTSGLAVVARPQGSSFRQIWYVGYPKGPSKRLGNDIDSYIGASLDDKGSSIVSVQLQTLSNIYVAPPNEPQRATQVTPGTGRYFDLSWANNNRILYASDTTGEANLWSVNADGSDQRQITSEAGLNWAPVSSPDGRYIAFHTNRSGTWNIWRANPDGTNTVQLTTGTQDSNWPHFTPDSRHLLFHRTDSKGLWSIWRVPITGGPSVRLTSMMTTHPAVSSKHGMIAAWYTEKAQGPWKLAIFDSQGGQPLKVFTPAVSVSPDSQIAWTPDGGAITWIGQENGVWNLWLQPIDGRPAQRLTSMTSGQIYSFDWSSDGRLAFSHGVTTSDVVVVHDKRGSR